MTQVPVSTAQPAATGSPTPALSRRTLFAGAGAAGALAAVAVVLPSAPKQAAQTAAAAAGAAAAPADGGYRLTEHIKQYYATARV